VKNDPNVESSRVDPAQSDQLNASEDCSKDLTTSPRPPSDSRRTAPSADRSELADNGDAVVGQEPSSPIAGTSDRFPLARLPNLGAQRRARSAEHGSKPSELSIERSVTTQSCRSQRQDAANES
jgi:hypothetical protein